MTIYYGLIGCGMMGREHIRNIALLDNTAISVILEPNEQMASTALELAPDALIVETIDQLLSHQPLDCIVIASPNHCHVGQLEAIAKKVCLPLLVEKPLFTAMDDLKRILKLKADYGAPIWVAMEYRYMPPMQQFIQSVQVATGGVKMLTIIEHRFPFLKKVNNWNRFNENSGGTFVEKCCHFFDLMRHILNSDPVRIMASAGQNVNHRDEIYDGQRPDILDCGYVIVDFKNGARALLELSMFAEGSEYQEMIHAVGPEGKLEVKLPGPARFWTGPADKMPVPVITQSPRMTHSPKEILCPIDEAILAAGDHNGSTFHQHQRFLNVISSEGDVEVGLDDGIWAVQMGLAAQESARTGEAVHLTSPLVSSRTAG